MRRQHQAVVALRQELEGVELVDLPARLDSILRETPAGDTRVWYARQRMATSLKARLHRGEPALRAALASEWGVSRYPALVREQ